MPKTLLFILSLLIVYSCSTTKSLNPLSNLQKLGKNPVWLIDSVQTSFDSVKAVNAFDISNISVLLPKKAKKQLGNKGIDGAIYITTVKAAKIKYWRFFSSKSEAYRYAIRTYQADSSVLHFLNGKQLSDSAVGTLYLINDKVLKDLKFVRLDTSQNISHANKEFVLYIEAKRPKELKTNKDWK